MTYAIKINKLNETLNVDFDALPEVSQKYIIHYGLKKALADVHAAIKETDYKTVDDFLADVREKVETKYAALLDGTIRQASGKITNPVAAEAMRLAVAMVSNAIIKKGGKLKDYTMKDLRDRGAALIERNPEITERAEKNVAETQAAMESIDIDDMDDII